MVYLKANIYIYIYIYIFIRQVIKNCVILYNTFRKVMKKEKREP